MNMNAALSQWPKNTMKVCLCCSNEENEDRIPEGMPPKVVEVYKSVGKIMSRYKAGKVPKAFKIIPNLKNWEEVNLLPTQTLLGPSGQPFHVQRSICNMQDLQWYMLT